MFFCLKEFLFAIGVFFIFKADAAKFQGLIIIIYTLGNICNNLSVDCHSADFCRYGTLINGGLEKGIL